MMPPTATPPPARTRTGTFDGLDKLFFDKARAIEAGEMTAPPEIIARPRTPFGKLAAWWQSLATFQQIALVVAAAALACAAAVMY